MNIDTHFKGANHMPAAHALRRNPGQAVSAVALALVLGGMGGTAPAYAAVPVLEPDVVLAQGRATLPEAVQVVAATDDAVVLRRDRGGLRMLSGPGLSQVHDVAGDRELTQILDFYRNGAGIVGDWLVYLSGSSGTLVVPLDGSAAPRYVPGYPIGRPTATGWLEMGPNSTLLAVTFDDGEVTRRTVTGVELSANSYSAYVSPSGQRAVVDARNYQTGQVVLIDVDPVAATATVLAESDDFGFTLMDLTDDAYVVRMPDFSYERRGSSPTRWEPAQVWVTPYIWGDGTLYEDDGVKEVRPDGTVVPVPESDTRAAVANRAIRTGPTSAWTSSLEPGVVHRVTSTGVSDVTTMPPAPLDISAVDLAAGTVRWIDDSGNSPRETADLWSRDLRATGPRTHVLPRATGRSFGVTLGSVFAMQHSGLPHVAVGTLTRTDAETSELARHVPVGRVSAGDRHIAATSRGGALMGDVLVDLDTSEAHPAPAGLSFVSGPWTVATERVGDQPALRVTATHTDGTVRTASVPGFELLGAEISGTTMLVRVHTSAGGGETFRYDLSGSAAPVNMQLPWGAEVLATDATRYAVHLPATGEVVLRTTADDQPVASLDVTGVRDPVVALEGTHVVWTEAGPDGERLVAAELDKITPPVDPPSFSDVPLTNQFADDIAWLVQQGIATGYAGNMFQPTAAVSRQAMAAFLYRSAGEPAFTPPATATFGDVPVGSTFFREVEWLADSGIAGGFPDGTFRPTAPVSRQAMAAFLHRYASEPAPGGTAPTFPDVTTGNQFRTQITWLASTGITGGYDDGTFRPTAAVSRQAMAAFLHRYHDLQR